MPQGAKARPWHGGHDEPATPHGHASLQRGHSYSGKFALANLLADAIVKDSLSRLAKILTHYRRLTKDMLIVPLLTGAAPQTGWIMPPATSAANTGSGTATTARAGDQLKCSRVGQLIRLSAGSTGSSAGSARAKEGTLGLARRTPASVRPPTGLARQLHPPALGPSR